MAEKDYKSVHLAWVYKTKTFVPKYAQDYTTSYYEVMKEVYRNKNVTNKMAKIMYYADKRWHKVANKIMIEADKELNDEIPEPTKEWFITIGFNHQTWSVAKCKKVIEKILAMDWVKKAKANFELYRENGEHPHVHFMIETDIPRSKILDKLWRPRYVKDVVLARNFIDIKPAEIHHNNYIMLNKTEHKMKYIDKDIEWRKKNDIPDYEKNWWLPAEYADSESITDEQFHAPIEAFQESDDDEEYMYMH